MYTGGFQNNEATKQDVRDTQSDFANKVHDILKAAQDQNESIITVKMNDKIDSLTKFLEDTLDQKDKLLQKQITELGVARSSRSAITH